MNTLHGNTLPILYSFRRCPYAMRARMALISAGVAVEHREILLKDKPPSMLLVSPKGTVPVLVLSDGSVIDESAEVMVWAFDQAEGLADNWLGVDRSLLAEYEILRWRCDGEFKDALDHYKYADRYEHPPAYYRELALPFLAQLEQKLTGNQYLLANVISIADIAIMPFIRQFAYVDRSWFDETPYPKLIDWLDRMLASELFTQAMEKNPLWVDPTLSQA